MSKRSGFLFHPTTTHIRPQFWSKTVVVFPNSCSFPSQTTHIPRFGSKPWSYLQTRATFNFPLQHTYNYGFDKKPWLYFQKRLFIFHTYDHGFKSKPWSYVKITTVLYYNRGCISNFHCIFPNRAFLFSFRQIFIYSLPLNPFHLAVCRWNHFISATIGLIQPPHLLRSIHRESAIFSKQPVDRSRFNFSTYPDKSITDKLIHPVC